MLKTKSGILIGLFGVSSLAYGSGYPEPGKYLIDSESTTTAGTGAAFTESITPIDGASGQYSVTLKTGDSGPPIKRTYKGEGPVSWCVPQSRAGAAPTTPHLCDMRTHTKDASSAAFSANCRSARIEENWRQLDTNTWERVLNVTPRAVQSATGAGSPRTAIDMVMASMSPAERARAANELATLPTAHQSEQAMAPVIQALEEQIRTASPAEAAAAKQQLRALRALGEPNPSAPPVTQVRELWRRVANACTPKR